MAYKPRLLYLLNRFYWGGGGFRFVELWGGGSWGGTWQGICEGGHWIATPDSLVAHPPLKTTAFGLATLAGFGRFEVGSKDCGSTYTNILLGESKASCH